MEPHTIQLVVTVLLIAAASAVALVCDYLRSKSQQWPEMAVALNRGSDLTAASPLISRVTGSQKETPASAEPAPMPTYGRVRPRPVPPPDARLPRFEDMDPRQAFAEWLDEHAAKLPAKRTPEEAVSRINTNEVSLPAPPALQEICPPTADEIQAVLCRSIVKRYEADAIDSVADTPAADTPVADTPAADTPAADVDESAPASATTPATPDPVASPAVNVFLSTRTLDSFGASVAAKSKLSAQETYVDEEAMTALLKSLASEKPRFEVIEGAGSSLNSVEVMLPPGMHERVFLNRAIASGKPFRGLVVSIGVNDLDGSSSRNIDLLKSIGSFIRGLLNGGEFACCSGDAEFLIVCPALEGADGHRRLIRIAEQLWDYQLRGISTWSIVFSWGGADVHHQPLSEAVAMANEQMNETRRGRRLVSIDSRGPARKAAI
jgi:hypothetical protein